MKICILIQRSIFKGSQSPEQCWGGAARDLTTEGPLDSYGGTSGHGQAA